MVYKGSASNEHVSSDPLKRHDAGSRRSSAGSIGGTPPALLNSPTMLAKSSSDTVLPGVPTAKKRRLEDVDAGADVSGQDNEELPSTEPEDKTPRNWEMAYRKATLAYFKMKGKLIAKDTKLVAKDAKLMEKDAKFHQLEDQLKQEVNQLQQAVNQREQNVNELEVELQSFKVKMSEMKSYNDYLHHTIANTASQRRPHVPTHIPTFDDAIRNRKDYVHREAPREGIKDIRGFQPTLHYAAGNGKVGPGRYGSNANWDLGLCHVHFRTPDTCEHGAECEFRHRLLTLNERSYIRFLTKGNDFLRHIDEVIMRKSRP